MTLSVSNMTNAEKNDENEKMGMPSFSQLDSIAGSNVESTLRIIALDRPSAMILGVCSWRISFSRGKESNSTIAGVPTTTHK